MAKKSTPRKGRKKAAKKASAAAPPEPTTAPAPPTDPPPPSGGPPSEPPPPRPPRPPSPPPTGIDDKGRLDEATLRRFVFQTFGRARRTQDSPVMPDVWLRYIRIAERMAWARIDPDHPTPNAPPLDLLVTPWSGVRPGQIAEWLRGRLRENSAQFDGLPWSSITRIASSDSRV